MIKKYTFITVLLGLIIFVPFTNVSRVYAAGLVPDCGISTPKLDKDGKEIGTTIKNPCDFDDVMGLINNIIDFLLKFFATPLAALALTYAGGILIFSGGSPESRTKAKKIIKNVIIGYIIALAAWLIVKTILSWLGFDPKDAYLLVNNPVLLYYV